MKESSRLVFDNRGSLENTIEITFKSPSGLGHMNDNWSLDTMMSKTRLFLHFVFSRPFLCVRLNVSFFVGCRTLTVLELYNETDSVLIKKFFYGNSFITLTVSIQYHRELLT